MTGEIKLLGLYVDKQCVMKYIKKMKTKPYTIRFKWLDGNIKTVEPGTIKTSLDS
jgi:hypothetical protein